MGAWNTLHLFDSDQFYDEGVTRLRTDKERLKIDYSQFIKTHLIGGVYRFTKKELDELIDQSVQTIIDTSNQFDSAFKKHNEYNAIVDYGDKRVYLNQHEHYHDFGQFLEYFLFKYFADFYPHLNCGEGGLYGRLVTKKVSVAAEIIGNLESGEHYFCPDRLGIVNWISKEDTEILFHSKEDFYTSKDYDWLLTSFFQLVYHFILQFLNSYTLEPPIS